MNNNHALLIIFLIIAAFIVAPLIPYIIRKRDFKRQIRGDKPERAQKNNKTIPYYQTEDLKKKSDRDDVENIRVPPW